MKRLIRRSALAICILAVAAQASAQVVLLSQSRSVSGGGTLGSWWYSGLNGDYTLIATDGDTISAPDFGLFEEEISIDLTSNPIFGSLVSVTQDSEIQTGHFSIHGSAAVTASWPAGGSVSYGYWFSEVSSGANSHFEVLFEVSTPTSFSLAGSLATTYTGTDIGGYDIGTFEFEQIASLQLDRDGVPYLSFSVDQSPYTGEEIAVVSEFGILEPGTYTLTVYASTYIEFYSDEDNATGSSFSSFDIDFFLETPVAVEETTWGQVKAMFR